MNKTFLIFRHEFLNTIRRAWFIIMTLAIPVLAILAIGIFQLVSPGAEPKPVETTIIGYVDESGGFNQAEPQGNIEFARYGTQDEAKAALIGGDVNEYIVIPPDYRDTRVVNRYTLNKEVETPPATAAAIRKFLIANLLDGKVPPETVALVDAPVRLVVTRLTETGAVAAEQGGIGNIIVPGVFSLLLALSLMSSSSYLIQGMGEEKENRLIEVLLSSVSARQLLIGKVLGLGVAGLLQVVVWLATLPVLLSLASATYGGFLSTIQIPANFVVLGIVYFLLGYLLFAALAAGVGAVSPNAREGQQLSMIYAMFTYVPLWLSGLLINFPDTPLWPILTIFPVTAPVATMLRLGVSDIVPWQLAASLGVMAVSVALSLFLAIRVFRVYLLMYGKRPSFGEVFRNLRQG